MFHARVTRHSPIPMRFHSEPSRTDPKRRVLPLKHKELSMGFLWWAVIFLIIAIIAGAFGFRKTEAASASIAKVLFAIFLIVFLVFVVLAILGVGAAAVTHP